MQQKVDGKRTWADLIEGVESKKRAHYHDPNYPDHAIGVQELIPLPEGRGRFRVGMKIMLSDSKVNSEILDLWPKGSTQPRWLVRCPC